MTKPKVSVIIVNYKVKEELFKCLASIYASKPKTSFEVIVVDNEKISTIKKDLTKKFPKVKYLKSDVNLGYGGGNNLGAKYSSGEYLFFLNPDTLILNNAIDVLVKSLTKNEQTGIVAPLLLDKNNVAFKHQGALRLTPLRAIFSLSFLNKLPFNRISSNYYLEKWNKGEKKEVDVVPGTAFVISKNLFNKAGGFDEKFFLYFEEFDLCDRVKELGYKIYIEPKAKVFHQWEASTRNVKNINSIFSKSRFLYFRKHHGLLKALLVEGFLRINTVSLLIFGIFFLALFLRTINLSKSMVFIGDQGWYYLSAKELLINGNIPLVGITSSHTWLHQGPLWTYMLSVVLFFSNFSPFSGGYLTAFFGALTTFLIYRLGGSIFSRKVGFIAAILYATSPLIVFSDRMPFDPSPIPFFTVLLFFCIHKWTNNKISYFPFIILLIFLLYNLELATFSLFFPFILLIFYGYFKNKDYVNKLFNAKIIFYSVSLFIFSMFPIIVYDFSNGFKQTVVFFGWTIYKPFSFIFKHSGQSPAFNIGVMYEFITTNLQKLIFQFNLEVSLIIFFLGFIYLIYVSIKKEKNMLGNPRFLLLFFSLFLFGGILINQTPSDAYLPIIFPFIIFQTALFFDFLMSLKIIKYFAVILLFFIVSFNGYFTYKDTFNPYFENRIKAVDKIINLANNNGYSLIGKGPGSQFESYTMNYEYLLWWKGYPPSKTSGNLKIYISEDDNGIHLEKKELK